MKSKIIRLAIYLLCVGHAYALGSLSTDDVIPILRQNSTLYDCLVKTFDFSKGAVGRRIGNVGEAHLGGARVAPYEFNARPKGSTGPWIFLIVVEADTKYFKKNGETATLFDGEVIKETLTGVRIEPLKQENPPNQAMHQQPVTGK